MRIEIIGVSFDTVRIQVFRFRWTAISTIKEINCERKHPFCSSLYGGNVEFCKYQKRLLEKDLLTTMKVTGRSRIFKRINSLDRSLQLLTNYKYSLSFQSNQDRYRIMHIIKITMKYLDWVSYMRNLLVVYCKPYKLVTWNNYFDTVSSNELFRDIMWFSPRHS